MAVFPRSNATNFAALALVFVMATLSAGCAESAKAPSKPASPVVGADRDAQGCIGSAGYAWCAREARCVRPWELAQEKKSQELASSAEAFKAFCAVPASAPAATQK